MLDLFERNSLFKRISDLGRSADHVKRVLVVNILVRRYLPAKLVPVHVVDQLHHRDACEPRLERISIGYVNLHSAAGDSRMFLKSWLECAASEKHAGQSEAI